MISTTVGNKSFLFSDCSIEYLSSIQSDFLYKCVQCLLGLPIIIFGLIGHSIIAISLRKNSEIVLKGNYRTMLMILNMFSISFLLFMIPKLFTDKFSSVPNVIVVSSLFGEMYRIIAVSLTGLFAYERIIELLGIKIPILHPNDSTTCIISCFLALALGFNYFQVFIMTTPAACDDPNYILHFIWEDLVVFNNTDLYIYFGLLVVYQSVFTLLFILAYFSIVIWAIYQRRTIPMVYSHSESFNDIMISNNMMYKASIMIFLMFCVLVAPQPILQIILVNYLDEFQYLKFQMAVFYFYIINSSMSAAPFLYFCPPIIQDIKVASSVTYWREKTRLTSVLRSNSIITDYPSIEKQKIKMSNKEFVE